MAAVAGAADTGGCAGGFCAGSCAHACGSGPAAIRIASKAASRGRIYCRDFFAASPNTGRLAVPRYKSRFAVNFSDVMALLTLRIQVLRGGGWWGLNFVKRAR